MISLRGEIGDGRQLGEGGADAEAGSFYLPNIIQGPAVKPVQTIDDLL